MISFSTALASRKTPSGLKVRQALTWYLVVHLTDSTTLTAHIEWSSTRHFRNFLASHKFIGPAIIVPDALPSSRGFKDTSIRISRLTARTPSSRYSFNNVTSPNYPVRLTAYKNCTTLGVSLPRSLLVVVYFGSCRARGKDDSCFCREILHVDVVVAIP
jgi:hypothetical protein